MACTPPVRSAALPRPSLGAWVLVRVVPALHRPAALSSPGMQTGLAPKPPCESVSTCRVCSFIFDG